MLQLFDLCTEFLDLLLEFGFTLFAAFELGFPIVGLLPRME